MTSLRTYRGDGAVFISTSLQEGRAEIFSFVFWNTFDRDDPERFPLENDHCFVPTWSGRTLDDVHEAMLTRFDQAMLKQTS